MNQKRPVVVLGLDAAEHALIERWAAEGQLPVFAKLLDEGAYGILDTTASVFSGSAWVSIATGCGPAQCGVYSRYQLVNGTYDVRRVKSEDCRLNPFWASFSGPVVVVDLPKTPLLSGMDGVQIVEWGAYDHYAQYSTSPANFSERVIDKFGRHPFLDGTFEVALHGRRDFEALRELMIQGIKMKQRLNRTLMMALQPRLFFSVFCEPHAAGHAFWRFLDPRHPGYDANGPFATFLLDVYRAVDNAVGEFLETLPRDAVFVVVSSQGFGLDSMADEDFLSELLVKLGVSVPRFKNGKYAPYAPGMVLDMTRSRCFSLPTDLQGYIRINLEGREPNGVIPESGYESVCQELEGELLALRHLCHGAPVVKEVVRVRDRFRGTFADALPDLSVVWNDDYIVTEAESPRCGLMSRQPDLSAGGGNHRGPGFMLLHGSGVKRSRFFGHVFDIAPTLCALLGEISRPEWEGEVADSRMGL
jgi:predicted AlkP superfamily phosphohydrolase/phosphomutase